ncbi:hypothetical protein [Aliiglaciecola aliphaticivorans]
MTIAVAFIWQNSALLVADGKQSYIDSLTENQVFKCDAEKIEQISDKVFAANLGIELASKFAISFLKDNFNKVNNFNRLEKELKTSLLKGWLNFKKTSKNNLDFRNEACCAGLILTGIIENKSFIISAIINDHVKDNIVKVTRSFDTNYSYQIAGGQTENSFLSQEFESIVSKNSILNEHAVLKASERLIREEEKRYANIGGKISHRVIKPEGSLAGEKP